jgi:orotate phosphoribosyltransferase
MNKIIEMFKKTDALLEGHFLLTSGLHSPVYFQCALVLQYPQYCEYLSKRIVDHFKNNEIDLVISPAIGGIVVGQEVGRQLGKRTIFTERVDGKMKLRRGFQIKRGEKALICEDVITTGGSVFEVINIVKENGAEPHAIGYIVDRRVKKIEFGVEEFAVTRVNAQTYPPEHCPLCKDHIPLIKPGSRV